VIIYKTFFGWCGLIFTDASKLYGLYIIQFRHQSLIFNYISKKEKKTGENPYEIILRQLFLLLIRECEFIS